MKTLITTYRGFDINFDTDKEIFSCILIDTDSFKPTVEDTKTSKSFASVKKSIDDYIKENGQFEPFNVIANPNSYGSGYSVKITGIRKDGRFVGENSKGEKCHISDYQEDSFILDLPEHEKHLSKIVLLQLEQDDIRKKIAEEKLKVVAPSLKDLKPKYQAKQ